MRKVLLVAAVAPLLLVSSASASTSTTRDGRTLTVSKSVGLKVEGETVRVTGRGYDRSKGIYVAFCVDNGVGKAPTPCGGGADTEGSSGNSVWVSDFPPYYGTGLAKPYGEGGTFDVTINVRAQLNEDVDCRKARCAVVTRADHTRSEDRSQDVAVPISFANASPAPHPEASTAAGATPGAARSTPTGSASSAPSSSPTSAPTVSPPASVTAPAAPAATLAPLAAPAAATGPDVPVSKPGEGDGWARAAALAALCVAAAGWAWLRRRNA